jgi:hypothetical protein
MPVWYAKRMDETPSTAFEGYCEAHLHDEPCEDCAAEDRAFMRLRDAAARLAPRADEIERLLSSVEVSLGEVTSDHNYAEFYRLAMDDEDAAAFLTEARRAVRSFARIARERAARTEQEP